MSSPTIISDDDESFDGCCEPAQLENPINEEVIAVSSDIECDEVMTDEYFTSDEEFKLPNVELQRMKSTIIKNLFPKVKIEQKTEQHDSKNIPSTSVPLLPVQKASNFERMIGGVKVLLPVNPYGCQVALMAKVITAINKGQNCLLESPTGSGKTLALLCAALAWQEHEQNRVGQNQAQVFSSSHPKLNEINGGLDFIATPLKRNVGSAEDVFTRTTFGERSIYDSPVKNADEFNVGLNRQKPPTDKEPPHGQVNIHKKRRLNNNAFGQSSSSTSPQPSSTPEKTYDDQTPIDTPPKIRDLYNLLNNTRLRTSMLVGCSVPTIYYGARTHKQLQQVIKEFKRTAYCGEASMTLLSSREHSCLREYDRNQWSSKNDMCRECIKSRPLDKTKEQENGMQRHSNCKYYDNRAALNHDRLPPAFDLEDLVRAGEEIVACPYYAAKAMSASAQIIFCPYNYLIEPTIRTNMQIDLQDQIVIIDEAHNIEDICRDAATFTVTKDQILAAVKELDHAAQYRFANDVSGYIDYLLKAFTSWNDWFTNQTSLLENCPVNNDQIVYTWEVEHFVQTLNNHNIGRQQYNEFSESSKQFCMKFRDDPRALYGVTQVTSSLVESFDTVLGYIFRDFGKYTNDFKPVLVKNVVSEGTSENTSWRNPQFKRPTQEGLSLRLLCMNPGVVFDALKVSKCVILASGTLAPIISLHSELATEFPLQVSPNHVIPKDRVWIGTVTTCPDGQPLECKSRDTDRVHIQDALGKTVLWVCQVTPHGVLCFMPSYLLMNKLINRWQQTGVWKQLLQTKHVFRESRNTRDHSEIMEDYYQQVKTTKGAVLFAVYRGKVSEGMDFKDHQARTVITIGIPYPNTFDVAVKEKMKYNDRYASQKNLLSSSEWLRVQAYRALNQAVGRCVRHRNDWGAVLLIDARFNQQYYTAHLSKWVREFLGNNHHTFDSLVKSPNSLESFMQSMTIKDNEDN